MPYTVYDPVNYPFHSFIPLDEPYDAMALTLLYILLLHVFVQDGTYRAESPDELALVEGVSVFECGLGQTLSSFDHIIPAIECILIP